MFTGIIEETGRVERVRHSARSIELVIVVDRCGRGTKIGDSVAVNGCCLTVVRISGSGKRRKLTFDLLKETWDRTSFSSVRTGSSVNLERSLQVGDRLHGHFVTGHVDDVGRILHWEKKGDDHVLDIGAAPGLMRYIVQKGSIAVDGISLTVAEVKRASFRVWIIPHTRDVTSLKERRVGDAVNLEADLLGKYIEKLAGRRD